MRNEDKLFLAKSKININYSINGGFKGFITAGWTLSRNQLVDYSGVTNVLDAVEKFSGITDRRFPLMDEGGANSSRDGRFAR